MDEDRNNAPRKHLRDFLKEDDEDEISLKPEPQPEPQSPVESKVQESPPATSDASLLARLPQRKQPLQATPPPDDNNSSSQSKTTDMQDSPDQLSESIPVEQPKEEPENQTVTVVTTVPTITLREKLLRALWTTTSVISMMVNIIAIIVIVVAFWAYRSIKLPEGLDITIATNLLSGLYSNFEKMDQASIQTTIPVDAQIPLDISVPVQTTTQITLAESVVIPNAQVVINTGGLNINSNARVTLPAGTPLDVNLNFVLPVQTSIPVHLDVPVNIPMAETELHEPFVGLQNVVRPLYCLVDPNATNLNAQLICR